MRNPWTPSACATPRHWLFFEGPRAAPSRGNDKSPPANACDRSLRCRPALGELRRIARRLRLESRWDKYRLASAPLRRDCGYGRDLLAASGAESDPTLTAHPHG